MAEWGATEGQGGGQSGQGRGAPGVTCAALWPWPCGRDEMPRKGVGTQLSSWSWGAEGVAWGPLEGAQLRNPWPGNRCPKETAVAPGF